jgi:hypothetical protein
MAWSPAPSYRKVTPVLAWSGRHRPAGSNPKVRPEQLALTIKTWNAWPEGSEVLSMSWKKGEPCRSSPRLRGSATEEADAQPKRSSGGRGPQRRRAMFRDKSTDVATAEKVGTTSIGCGRR